MNSRHLFDSDMLLWLFTGWLLFYFQFPIIRLALIIDFP